MFPVGGFRRDGSSSMRDGSAIGSEFATDDKRDGCRDLTAD